MARSNLKNIEHKEAFNVRAGLRSSVIQIFLCRMFKSGKFITRQLLLSQFQFRKLHFVTLKA